MAQFVTINQTATGTALNITKANTAGVAISVLQNNTNNTDNVINITNSSQSHILNLTQSGPGGIYDGSAIRVAQNSPGIAALDISVAAGAAGCCAINIAHSGAQPAVAIVVNGITPEPGIVVTQSTNEDGIRVRTTTTSSTASCIDVINSAVNGGQAIKITQNTSGSGVYVSLPTDGGHGITIRKTDTTGGNLSSGNGLAIYNSSGASSVIISSNCTSTAVGAGYAVDITQSSAKGGGLKVSQATSDVALQLEQNSTVSSGDLAYMWVKNTTASGNDVLHIRNDSLGDGIYIEQMNGSSTSSGTACVHTFLQTAGYHILCFEGGVGTVFSVDLSGKVVLSGLNGSPENVTVASTTTTFNTGGSYFVHLQNSNTATATINFINTQSIGNVVTIVLRDTSNGSVILTDGTGGAGSNNLKIGSNMTMAQNATITLICTGVNGWVQISRSTN